MKKVQEIHHHRNGVCGLPFYVGIVKEDDEGIKRDMLVIRFPNSDKEAGAIVCAAFDLALLDARNIRFAENSWRGDHYARCMDDAIATRIEKEEGA